MFFEIARAVKQIKPQYLLLENVKGLLNHDKGETFGVILKTLDELGYDAEWRVLNSKDFGVPQNRERVYIIGYLRGTRTREVFPFTRESGEVKTDDEVICLTPKDENGKQTSQHNRVYSTNGVMTALCAELNGRHNIVEPKKDIKVNQIGNIIDTASFGGNPQRGRVYSIDGLSPCLNTVGGGGLEPKIKAPVYGQYMGVSKRFQAKPLKNLSRCLKASKHDAGVILNGVYRKLTPLECWRLQGFPDWAFYKAQEVNSDSQLYKQAGNSVTVNVIECIIRLS